MKMKDYFKFLLAGLMTFGLLYLFVKIPFVSSILEDILTIFKRIIEMFI